MLLIALVMATMPKPIGRPLPDDLGAYSSLYGQTAAAATRLDLTVDRSGAPVRCEVTMSDGNRALDRVACDMLMRRSRFTPALDADGVPIDAVVRHDFTINRATTSASPRRVDFALPVAALSKPGEVLVADVVLTTDATGHVTRCDVAASTSHASLDRAACREVTAAIFAPARDRDGKPVSALREVSVGFTAGDVPR